MADGADGQGEDASTASRSARASWWIVAITAAALVTTVAGISTIDARKAGAHAVDIRQVFWLPGRDQGLLTRRVEGEPLRRIDTLPLRSRGPIQVYHSFRLSASMGRDLALLLPASGPETDLYLNGMKVDGAPAPAATFALAPDQRPRFWRIPAEQLRPGLNRFDLIVDPGLGRAISATPVLGPSRTLQAAFEATAAMNATARAALFWLASAAVIAALLAAALGRRRSGWLAFAAAAAATGGRVAVEASPLEALPQTLPITAGLALLAASLACVVFGLRDTRLLRPAADGWRRLGGAAAAGVLVVTVAANLLIATPLPSPLNPALPHAIAGAGLAVLLGGLFVAGVTSAIRHGLRRARRRLNLGQVIAQQQAELKAAAAALEQNMQRAAILEERQRLARDMHDGIGGQLASLLAQVRTRKISHGDLESALAGGLSDLRLLVDSLDAVGETLSDALASFRGRVRVQAEAARMSLAWTQPDDLDLTPPDPRWLLNLYRLMQEAVTNAARHSGGDTLTVRIERQAERTVLITIADNGSGFDIATVERGRGLANMEHRAGQIGAALTRRPAEAGRGHAVDIVFTAPGPLAERAIRLPSREAK